MLNKTHNSIVTLAAVLLALVGLSKPAKAFLLAQTDTVSQTFTVPDRLPAAATVKVASSNSTSSINQSLKKSFIDKFPQAQVNIETQSSKDALQALSEGQVDLVGIGRNLTAGEKQQGFVAVPISREKIAIVVSKDSSYDGNLSISEFAKIFRGEITDWSEVGGQPGAINLVDSPDSNDTRQAFSNYPVFQESDFITGSNAVQLERDSIDATVAQLGANGISYAVANDVINRDDVKIVTMHQTQPDDERYPFSQPFYLVYQGTPSQATEAFLGFATSQGGEQVVANRVGSMSTAAAAAIASRLDNKPADAPTGTANLPETTLDGEGELFQADSDAETDETIAGVDADNDAETDETIAGVDADNDAETDGTDETIAGVDADNDVETDETIAGVDADSDAEIDETIAGVDADIDAEIDEAIAGVDADIDAETDETIAGVDADSDAETDETIAGVDADSDAETDETIAQNDSDLEGSGETNPDLEGSGETNPDLEGSGETNPDLEGSGETNPDLEGSGETNPDLEGSGETNPDLEGSGETNAVIDGDEETLIIPDAALENAEGEGTVATAEEGKWWWWLPLILGIPILAAIAVSGFGGRKRSDQEPAVGDFPSPNPFDGGGTSNTPNDGNLSAVGASGEAVVASNSSKLGGAAVAGGAAIAGGTAANFVGRRETTTSDLDDIKLDDSDNIEFSSANIDDPVVDETSSSPVGEFTGQQTKLQSTDSPTKLQTDTEIEEINLDDDVATNFGRANADVSNLSSGSVDSVESIELDLDTEIEDTQIDNDLDLSDGDILKAGSAAAIGGAATSALFSDRQDDLSREDLAVDESEAFVSEQTTKLQSTDSPTKLQTDTEIEEINLDDDVATNFGRANADVSDFSSGSVDSVESIELDLDTEIEDTQIDNDLDLSDGDILKAGSAAAIGGAATTSALFNDRQDDLSREDLAVDEPEAFVSEQTTKLQSDELDSDFNFGVTDHSTAQTQDAATSELDTEIEPINLDDNVASNKSFSDNVIADVETTSEDTDISLDEITFDDVDNSIDASLKEINLDRSNELIDLDLDEISFDDVDNSIDESLNRTDDSTEISLDEITFDDVDNSVDANLGEISLDDLEDKTLENTAKSDRNLDINLDELGFAESTDDRSSDLLSGNAAKITDAADDRSNDMDNISAWLDSLDTPIQNSEDNEDISGWLDKLNIQNNVPENEDSEEQESTNIEHETDESISFQFLEDLLERDRDKNPENSQ